MMKKTFLTSAVAAAVMGCAAFTVSADKGGFGFKPIDSSASSAEWSADAPWKLPKGFTQSLVSGEDALNIYDYPTWTDNNDGVAKNNDWHDMNTVNETGPHAGRYMYTTHEVRGVATGGSVSVVDLKTGETKILVQDPSWTALDGIRWTPWGTILFAEETGGGRLMEIELDANDLTKAVAVHERDQVGHLAHEGIEVDAEGNVYVVDEQRGRTQDTVCGALPCGGGIYKFVPDTYGDLSSGSLYVLGFKSSSSRRDNTGPAEWKGPIDPLNARASGSEFGGASYQRPEDVEVIGNTLYAAITEGPRDEYGKEYFEGRVLSINLDTMMVANFVKAGVNVPVEINKPGQEGFQTGFDSIDNLAEAPNGDLVIIEDNVPSDIWFASTRKVNEFGASKKVRHFASLSDYSAEGTGIYFSPLDPNTLYVNIQHSRINDGDGTWAISKSKNHRDGK